MNFVSSISLRAIRTIQAAIFLEFSEVVTIGGIIGIVRYASKLLFCSFSTLKMHHWALLSASANTDKANIDWKRLKLDFGSPRLYKKKMKMKRSRKSDTMAQ